MWLVVVDVCGGSGCDVVGGDVVMVWLVVVCCRRGNDVIVGCDWW